MKGLSYNRQKIFIATAFLIVPVILLIVFSFYPAVKLFEFSFSDWDGVRPYYNYVGFSNYVDLFKDMNTWRTLSNNFAYIVIMLVQIVMALYFAIILDTNIRGRNFFRSMIFVPYILNGVAVAFMFNYMYDFNSGPINMILKNIGLGQYAIRWLGDGYYINFSLALIALWKYMGFNMVIFIGALQSLPQELYEASRIDGANFYHNIRYIIIPNIKSVIEMSIFLGLNGALQAFSEAWIITKGGPAGRSATFITSTLDIAFKYQNFGKASAMGVMLLLIILAVVLVQKKYLRER